MRKVLQQPFSLKRSLEFTIAKKEPKEGSRMELFILDTEREGRPQLYILHHHHKHPSNPAFKKNFQVKCTAEDKTLIIFKLK